MKKKDEEELLEKECHCHSGEECTCGDDCTCDDCNCENCDCEDCKCDCCFEDCLPPIEEKLVLVGQEGEKETEKAIKLLDEKNIDYAFLDLNESKDDGFMELAKKVEVPSLLLIQTIVANAAFGLKEIKEAIED